jgi:CheY-like chemotaxis protein
VEAKLLRVANAAFTITIATTTTTITAYQQDPGGAVGGGGGLALLVDMQASRLLRSVPVVILSAADGAAREVADCLAAGAKEHFAKPLDVASAQLLRVYGVQVCV